MLKYLVLAIAITIPQTAAGQCIGGNCPLPSGGLFAPQPQQQQRPPGEPLKYPGWMCYVEGGLGFHVGGGLVATCYHGSSKEVTYQGKTYPARYITGRSLNAGDVAILKTDIEFKETVHVCDASPPIGAVVFWQGGSGRVTGKDADSLYVSCHYRLGDSGGPVWTADGVVSIVSATSPAGSIGANAETITQCIAEAKKILEGSGLVPLPEPPEPKPDPLGPTLQEIMQRLDDLTSQIGKAGQAEASQAEANQAAADQVKADQVNAKQAEADPDPTGLDPAEAKEIKLPATPAAEQQQPSNPAPWIPIDPLYVLLAAAAGVTGLGVPTIAIWGATIATRKIWKRWKDKRRRRSQATVATTSVEPARRADTPQQTRPEEPTSELPGGNSARFQGRRDTTEAEQFLRLRNLEGREPILDALVGAIALDRLEETIDSRAADDESKRQALDFYDYIHKTVNRLAPLAISSATN